MAQSEDEGLFEEKISLLEETVLVSREIILGGCPSSRVTFQEFLLVLISIAVTLDREKS